MAGDSMDMGRTADAATTAGASTEMPLSARVLGERCTPLDVAVVKELLKEHGFTQMPDEGARRYVLVLVFDEKLERAVGLFKQRGPAFLIGKTNFPGGKRELGESGRQAAARELAEETGLAVPCSELHHLASSTNVAVYTTVSSRLGEARTMESEPVYIFDVHAQASMAELLPQMFSPDFLRLLLAAHLWHRGLLREAEGMSATS